MPETVLQHRDRRRRYRAADRRRRAAQELSVAACAASYAAAQLGNGIGPVEARQAALEAAGELEAVATAVRRLAREDPATRRVMARLLRGQGLSIRAVADRCGVSERTVRNYLAS